MRDTMQLQEIEAVHPKFLVGLKNGLPKVLFTVAVGVDFATGLGSYRNAFTSNPGIKEEVSATYEQISESGL